MKTELKNLKDLNEEFRKDNIPQRLSGDEFNDYWQEQLKAEAVKRAKYYKKMRDKNKGSIDWIYFNGRLQECMEFNDLTEENLKSITT